MARFLKNKERRIREALLLRSNKGLEIARIKVNGGTHGIDRFIAAFNTGNSLIA